MRVYLTGFMGSGKTSVGRHLARRLAVPFVDLDSEIETAAGRRVTEIFADEGEASFRRRESAALRATLDHPAVVVATGGGTVTVPENRELMQRQGITVWLDASFATSLAHLGPAARHARPLFTDEAAAEELWRERLPLYRQAAIVVTVAPQDSPEAVTERLYRLLMERSCAT